MSACPSPDHLIRLLNGQLDQDDEAALVAHAETCKGCQDQLEALTLVVYSLRGHHFGRPVGTT